MDNKKIGTWFLLALLASLPIVLGIARPLPWMLGVFICILAYLFYAGQEQIIFRKIGIWFLLAIVFSLPIVIGLVSLLTGIVGVLIYIPAALLCAWLLVFSKGTLRSRAAILAMWGLLLLAWVTFAGPYFDAFIRELYEQTAFPPDMLTVWLQQIA